MTNNDTCTHPTMSFEWESSLLESFQLAWNDLQNDFERVLREPASETIIDACYAVAAVSLLVIAVVDALSVIDFFAKVSLAFSSVFESLTSNAIRVGTGVARISLFSVGTLFILSGATLSAFPLSRLLQRILFVLSDWTFESLGNVRYASHRLVTEYYIESLQMGEEYYRLAVVAFASAMNTLGIFLLEVARVIVFGFVLAMHYVEEELVPAIHNELGRIQTWMENELEEPSEIYRIGALILASASISIGLSQILRRRMTSKSDSPVELAVTPSNATLSQISNSEVPQTLNEVQKIATPIKEVMKSFGQAMTPFLTPRAIEESRISYADEGDASAFLDCATSVKAPKVETAPEFSLVDLSLDESVVETPKADEDNQENTHPVQTTLPRLKRAGARVGLQVTVLGENRPGHKFRRGGVGTIKKINDDNTVSVKFTIEGGHDSHVSLDNIVVGSHPNSYGMNLAPVPAKEEVSSFLLGKQDSIAKRRSSVSLMDVSNLTRSPGESKAATKSKPLFRVTRASDVNVSDFSELRAATRATGARTTRRSTLAQQSE